MNLESIEIPVDARKRELLEARFFDNKVSGKYQCFITDNYD